MAKKETDNGMFAQAETTPATAPATEVKKTTAPAIPSALRELAPFLTKPKQAFCAAGGTEQKFAQEVNFAMQAMLNNPYLVTCAKSDPDHLVEAIKNVGLTGLSLNPELRLGYLVPFKGKIKFMSSYMGKVDIVIRTGVVKTIQAELVYENEEFKYEKGIKPVLKHKPDVFAEDRGKLKCGYYIAILANGEKIFDVMPEKRIQEIKGRSEAVKSGKTSPWDTDFEEMAKKTIINWAFKSLPKTGISDDMLKTLEAEMEYEREDFEAWKKHQEQQQADAFTQDGKFTPYEEVTNENNQ
jgi:recombination protein RecT